MSQSHPARQSAQSDFLDSLEHLGETFGALDDGSLPTPGQKECSPVEGVNTVEEAIAQDNLNPGENTSESEVNPEGYDERNSRKTVGKQAQD
ncbi:MAG: hypothetical protein AAF889_10595 [Cyanobacteria bacterium P01_D01_bin.73]